MASRTSLAMLGGRDVFEKAFQFRAADNARKMGVYPFFRPLDFNDGPEAVARGRARHHVRLEQLPRPHDPPQGPRGRHRGASTSTARA